MILTDYYCKKCTMEYWYDEDERNYFIRLNKVWCIYKIIIWLVFIADRSIKEIVQ